MKGLEVSIQEILSSMQVRKIKSTKNWFAVTILSFPFWTIFISQVPPFLLKIFFTRYIILDSKQIINNPLENVSPLVHFVYFISHVFVCVGFFFTCHLYFEKKKKKKCTVYMYVHSRRWLGCTNKKTWHSVHRSIQIFAFNDLKSNYSKVLCESWSTTRVN